MTTSERDACLFLSLLQARAGASLVSRLGDLSAAELLEASVEDLAARAGMTEKAVRAVSKLKASFEPECLRRRLEERGIAVLTLADEGYPGRLREIPDPPPALFVDGEIPEAPCVALVGARKASVGGLDAARRLGRALGERGACVVSGLALGIDAAAHEGALAGGGLTVGVLGCGIDVVYPRGNRALFGRVRDRGALVSEYYLGETPLAWRFPARNRVIAGLCETVVVVEAAEKSGALITARHALEAGRDVWAVPGPLGMEQCRGSNRLLADGAAVLWDIEEFVEAVVPMSAGPVPSGGEPPVPPELPEAEAAALAAVGFEPTEADEVAVRTGLRMSELLPALTMLEIKGYLSREASGAFVRRAT